MEGMRGIGIGIIGYRSEEVVRAGVLVLRGSESVSVSLCLTFHRSAKEIVRSFCCLCLVLDGSVSVVFLLRFLSWPSLDRVV